MGVNCRWENLSKRNDTDIRLREQILYFVDVRNSPH